jgi:hypothetical protein
MAKRGSDPKMCGRSQYHCFVRNGLMPAATHTNQLIALNVLRSIEVLQIRKLRETAR